MIDTALFFLYKVALSKPNNQFAKAIYNKFKKAGDSVNNKSLESLLNIPFDDKTVLTEINPVTIEKKKDYRFLYLYLRAFRKFPNLLDEKYFGITFCDREDGKYLPQSILIQGGNGTGKTSVFGAMEYLFTERMSAACKQGFKQKDQIDDYVPFAGGKRNESKINVVTKETTFSLDSDKARPKEMLRLSLLPFFCSEYDVDKVVDEGLDRFVYEQMGYSLVIDIIEEIERERDGAVKQFGELEGLNRHQGELEKEIDDLTSQIDDLDKRLRMNDKLKPSYLSLAAKMCNARNPKTYLEDVKKYLSKPYIQQTDSATPANFKPLIKEKLEAEKQKMEKVLGKDCDWDYFSKQYSQGLKLLQSEQQEGGESVQIPTQFQNSNLDDYIEEFNLSRKCLLQIIDTLLKQIPSKLNDMASCVGQYEKSVQEMLQKKNDKEKRRTVAKIMANITVYEEYLKALKDEVYGTVDTLTSGTRELVNDVMQLFWMKDEKMALTYNKDNGKFNMDIIFQREDGTDVSFKPEKYLNTFRYKLYCMTLKMAIAFAVKKFYQINFPLVIDDIFYSSDFAHRSMVRDFFWHLFEKHYKIFKNNDLQVIFLTHDDVVIEAAYRGICDATGCSDVERLILFDYRESDDFKKVKMPHNAKLGLSSDVEIKTIAYS